MRTTVDIPDNTFRDLKIKAAREGKSLRDIVLRSIENELRPAPPAEATRKTFTVPVIPSTLPGTLRLSNEDIEDFLASS